VSTTHHDEGVNQIAAPVAKVPRAALDHAGIVLPDPAGLTEEQRRGAACVWGGERLTVQTAVDLGVRTDGLDAEPDLGGRWYPRGCRQHIAAAANLALEQHIGHCEQCVDDMSQCATGMALTRLKREAGP
jgi:hypothetical protein